MKKLLFLLALCLLPVFFTGVFAQYQYEDLIRIAEVSETVYASKGHEKFGRQLALLVAEANKYMSALVDKTAPKTTILVLSQEDWGKYTRPQTIYGMPHYGGTDGTTLVVAAEDNDFWRANMPPLNSLRKATGSLDAMRR